MSDQIHSVEISGTAEQLELLARVISTELLNHESMSDAHVGFLTGARESVSGMNQLDLQDTQETIAEVIEILDTRIRFETVEGADRFYIPREHHNHPAEVQSQVREFEVGDIVQADFVEINEYGTSRLFVGIPEVHGP